MQFKEDYINSGPIKIFVQHNNKKGEETVLFVHGYPDCHKTWSHSMTDFTEDYQVAALDLRGFYNSDAPENQEDYQLEKIYADIAEVISFLKPKDGKVHLVAHDWGSIISWGFISDPNYFNLVHSYQSASGVHPGIMRATVNEIFATFDIYLIKLFLSQVPKSWYIWLFQIPVLPELVMARLVTFWQQGLDTVGVPADDEMRFFTEKEILSITIKGINVYRQFIQSKQIDLPENCKLPVQIIVNDNDPFVKPGSLDFHAEYFTNTIFTSMPTGHWGHREQPGLFSGIVRNYIQKISANNETKVTGR